MSHPTYPLEPGRSETFPYQERFAHGISPLGPVCYFDAGTQGDLPPVVLVHALGTNLTLWEYMAPALACHTRVVGLDLPGCGRSAKPRQRYTLRQMSDAVLGLMDKLGLSEALILGHSFGGMVAADVALREPRRVLGLSLMNSSGFNEYPRPLHLLGRLALRPAVVAPLIRIGVNRVMGRIFATDNERTRRFIHQVVSRPDPRYAWEFAYYACSMITDLMASFTHRLHELTMPTLVIWGEEDALLRYTDVAHWVGKLPRATLLKIPECGHMPNIEHPDIVNEALLRFLQTEVGGVAWAPAEAARAG